MEKASWFCIYSNFFPAFVSFHSLIFTLIGIIEFENIDVSWIQIISKHYLFNIRCITSHWHLFNSLIFTQITKELKFFMLSSLFFRHRKTNSFANKYKIWTWSGLIDAMCFHVKLVLLTHSTIIVQII